MFNESELLTHFHKILWNAEVLALKSLHDIEIPLCGYLSELTSSDCLKLIRSELDNWANINQPSMERILLNYIITDYINCGLSSPMFYTVFHKTLQSDKSKIKLLKDLTKYWDYLLKNYEITSVNVDFIKHFVVSLECLLLKISNFHNCIKFQCIQVIDRLKYKIKMFDKNILDCQISYTLSDIDNNIEEPSSIKKKLFNVENRIENNLKVNPSVPSLCLQMNQSTYNINDSKTLNNAHKENLDLHNCHQIYCSGTIIDLDLPKTPTLLSNVKENSLNQRIKPGLDGVLQPEQKLDAFQIMMFNAKKRKTKGK